jgi:hypothetical protein
MPCKIVSVSTPPAAPLRGFGTQPTARPGRVNRRADFVQAENSNLNREYS